MIAEPAGASPGRGPLIGGVAVALAALLAALALVYANATGVARVAEEATVQQLAESALGASAAARNAIGQVLLVIGSDTVDPAIAAGWIEEAQLVLDDLRVRVERLAATGRDSGIAAALAAVGGSATRTLEAARTGDGPAAGTIAIEEAVPAFDRLTSDLVAIRDDAARAIAAARLEAGSTATASRFMVALFVPSLAVLGAVVVGRRRRKADRLTADLDAARALNRSKDQLLANLSHELRTPLTGIYTSALTIEELGEADPETSHELNGLIIEQSADLTRMVEDLLASAQSDAGRLVFTLSPIPVAREVAAVVREFSRAERRVQVEVAEHVVVADPGRLRQLLRNLVSNAVRHGGPTVSIRGSARADGYLLEVIDDGPGVPDEVAPRLFERFVHQGDRPLTTGSVGLGLAISRVLAEGMGGTIAYRRTGGNTVFSVVLRPAAPDQGVRAA